MLIGIFCGQYFTKLKLHNFFWKFNRFFISVPWVRGIWDSKFPTSHYWWYCKRSWKGLRNWAREGNCCSFLSPGDNFFDYFRTPYLIIQ